MARLSLHDIAQKTGGEIIQGDPSICFETFNFDSRQTKKGELFFALSGARDGHDFILDAHKRGASGAVISHSISNPNQDFALIQVSDTLKALQDLARNVLSESQAKVIGITGSIGKTTTKVFLSSLLSAKYHVLQSEGNFNNHIGLPLSLLNLSENHEIAVLEMAMNAPGEILTLTRIAKPDYAVITNIKPVHIEFFPSLQDIAAAKKEILDGMAGEGTIVINGDDPLVRQISSGWKGRKITFGFDPGCHIRAQNIRNVDLNGITFDLFLNGLVPSLTIGVFYKSYLMNFLAAAGIASAFSLSIEEIREKISALKPLPMRGQIFCLKDDLLMIDDSYNSNPFALESALNDLKEIPCQRRVAVLGDMLELGEKSESYHKNAGRKVRESGWDILVTVGPESAAMAQGAEEAGLAASHIHSFADSIEAKQKISDLVRKGDLILVKGSRGIKMEAIVDSIKRKGS